MGQIEKQLEFSEEELLTFLADLEEEDEKIVEAEYDSAEALSDVLQEADKPKIFNQNKAYETAQRHKEKIRKINESAFNQKIIDLNDYISKEHAQFIIQELCNEFDRLIAKYSDYITLRCNKLLAAQIPRALRAAYKSYPQAFVKTPGFVYTLYAEGIKDPFFYVKLNIPYYFTQGTEQTIIEGLGLKYYKRIHEAIYKIEQYRRKKFEAEATYALKMAQLPKSTYLELLKTYPMWFNILLKALSTDEFITIPK